MNTSRRRLLGAGAALALPAFLSRALAQDSAARGADDATLASARQRARAIGKPLLVVFADPAGAVGEAGRIWGEFFLHATPETWLDLALVEVVCLSRATLADANAPTDRGPRWGVVVETDESSVGARPIEGPLPAGGHWREHDVQGQRVRERAAALAALVRAAILPDDDARARRRDQSMRSLPAEMGRTDDEWGRFAIALTEARTARLVDLDRFAAPLRFPEPVEGHERLAAAARNRLLERDPEGASWQLVSNHCPPCGMGFVPAESRYFLRFFAQ